MSFHIESLFTNMSLNKAINTILDQMYLLKLLKTNLKKRAMNNILIEPSCTTTEFYYDDIFYQQFGEISMSYPLVLVLANIISTEFEKSGGNASHGKWNLKSLL